MKKLFMFLFGILLLSDVFAQSPEKFSYQAVIRNISNQLVTNQVIGMQISILQGSTSGTAVYVETHTPTTNANGLVTIEIGGGTVVNGNITNINWSNGPYFIKTETDLTGGTNYTITGTSQLLSVPYALYAKTAGVAQSGGQTVIQNDSLVLKDAQGVTRMILNPNTGTFKMMNKDTVWYEMSVQSPLEQRIQLDNGNTLVIKADPGGTGSGSKVLYDKSGKKIQEEKFVNQRYNTLPPNEETGSINESYVKYYDNNENLIREESIVENDVIWTDKVVSNYTKVEKDYITKQIKETKVIKSTDAKDQSSSTETLYDLNGKILEKEFTDMTNPLDKNGYTEKYFYDQQGALVNKTKEFFTEFNRVDGTSILNSKYKNETNSLQGENFKTSLNEISSTKSGNGVSTYDLQETNYYSSKNEKLGYQSTTNSVDENSKFITTNRYGGFVGSDIIQTKQTFYDGLLQNETITKNGNTYLYKKDIFKTNDFDVKNEYFFDDNGNLKYKEINVADKVDNKKITQIMNPDGNQATTFSQGTANITMQYTTGNFTGTTNFNGNLNVSGTKNFRITHPKDTSKYLVHAAIESNEVLNMYSGNVITNKDGLARISLPYYFNEINTDFRYVLTVIGQTFAQAIVWQEIDANNQFVIKTNVPNVKVSWQVIAKRNDSYMQSHPFIDEIYKYNY